MYHFPPGPYCCGPNTFSLSWKPEHGEIHYSLRPFIPDCWTPRHGLLIKLLLRLMSSGKCIKFLAPTKTKQLPPTWKTYTFQGKIFRILSYLKATHLGLLSNNLLLKILPLHMIFCKWERKGRNLNIKSLWAHGEICVLCSQVNQYLAQVLRFSTTSYLPCLQSNIF